ncbi:unnamed protein product [Orchesella dallaii]|uniref:Uncharacterized protein n=1 Tax=Orchesella dallaii TaxID=48710 RepID=A0ABP1QIY9_9HEXA
MMEEITELLNELKLDWSSSELPIKDKVMKLKSFVTHVKEDPSSPLMEDELDELLSSISTSDFTAKRLRLELANEFQRPDPIVDTIKMEETYLVRRALSFSWIFEEAKSDMTDPDLLLRSILPIVAYTTRSRIIKQLGKHLKNEELAQQIFAEVDENYGSSCATDMLFSCSSDFIREKLIDHFNNHRLMPSDQVLRRIAVKDFQIAMDYLKILFSEIRDKLYDQQKMVEKRRGYNLTLKYLWFNHPTEVWALYEMFDTKILPKMTWQSAKKLLKTDKKLIVNAKKFAELIPERRRRLVAKYLRSTFQPFFSALFPEEMEQFPGEIPNLFQWLLTIPRIKKFTILNTGFRENYRCDILGVPEYISPEIMEILPLGHREQVARMKIDAGDLTKFGDPDCDESKRYMEAYWHSYMGIKKSVPKLKEILFEEIEMKIRSEVAELLVYTCYINDRDIDSLISICKLIISKWVHGHNHIRDRFLKAIEEKFGYRKLNRDAMWEALEEFIKLAVSNHEPVPKLLLEGIIEYHLKTHQPIDPFLVIMISKPYIQKYGPPDWEFLKHDPELHKQFLRQATDQICTRFPWEDTHLQHESENQWIRIGIVTLCETFARWNQRNRKMAKQDRLSVTEFPWLVCRLREIIVTHYSECSIQHQMRVIDALKTDPEIQQGYFKEYVESCPLSPILEHFLRTDPKEIQFHISTIIPFILRLEEKVFKTYKPFFLQIKIQGFPHFQAAVVESCLEIAQDDTATWNERRNALLTLTYLWDAKSYLNTVTLFYPDDDPDGIMGGESSHMDFRVRTTVVESLSQVSTSTQYITDAFACLLKFCVLEDYLHASVGPLTSLCLHASLREAVKFLKEDLLDRDISIKKHAIRLICQISDKTEDFQELLAYLWENETHHTIKETVLSQMFQFLGERPTAENWGFLKGALNSLNSEDKELLQQFFMLTNVVHVPAEFLPDYFLTCLEKFPDTSAKGKSIEIEFKAAVLGIAPRFINYLPVDFIDHLLQNFLFLIKEPEIIQVRAIDLAVAYCLKANSTLPEVGEVLKNCIIKLSPPEKWNYSKQSKRMIEIWTRAPSTHYPARQALYTFVTTLCSESFKKLAVQGKPLLTTVQARQTYKFINDIIETNFNKQDTFTAWFYLKCGRIFCPIQFHYVSNDGKIRAKEIREEGFRLLTDAGMRFQNLVDEQIKNYGPFVLGFITEKLISFFADVCQENESLLEKEKVIFFIDGLLKPFGENGIKSIISQGNQILAIELMPSSSPQCMYFRRKYADCQDTVTKLCGRTTRIFLCDRYSTRF